MNFKKIISLFFTLKLHGLVFFSETSMDNTLKLHIFFYDYQMMSLAIFHNSCMNFKKYISLYNLKISMWGFSQNYYIDLKLHMCFFDH